MRSKNEVIRQSSAHGLGGVGEWWQANEDDVWWRRAWKIHLHAIDRSGAADDYCMMMAGRKEDSVAHVVVLILLLLLHLWAGYGSFPKVPRLCFQTSVGGNTTVYLQDTPIGRSMAKIEMRGEHCACSRSHKSARGRAVREC